jgi:hypothetical protein
VLVAINRPHSFCPFESLSAKQPIDKLWMLGIITLINQINDIGMLKLVG